MNPNEQPNQVPDVPQPQNIPAPVQVPGQAPAPVEPIAPVEVEQDLSQAHDQPTELPQIEPVQWQAAEYLQHSKQPIWYVGFVVVIVVLMTLAIILMKSITFAVLIPVMAAALIIYSHRPPRQLMYVVSEKGLYINDQLHAMGEFKAFGVTQEGMLHSLSLIPIKRFRPTLVVYFPAEVGEQLVDLLGSYLPMQEIHPDVFDRIIHKLRI